MGWNVAIVTWLSLRGHRLIRLWPGRPATNRVAGYGKTRGRPRLYSLLPRADTSRRTTRHDVGLDGFQCRRFAIFGTPARCLAAIGHDLRREGSVTRSNAAVTQTAFQRNEFDVVNGKSLHGEFLGCRYVDNCSRHIDRGTRG